MQTFYLLSPTKSWNGFVKRQVMRILRKIPLKQRLKKLSFKLRIKSAWWTEANHTINLKEKSRLRSEIKLTERKSALLTKTTRKKKNYCVFVSQRSWHIPASSVYRLKIKEASMKDKSGISCKTSHYLAKFLKNLLFFPSAVLKVFQIKEIWFVIWLVQSILMSQGYANNLEKNEQTNGRSKKSK